MPGKDRDDNAAAERAVAYSSARRAEHHPRSSTPPRAPDEPKTKAGKRTINLPAFLCEMLRVQIEDRAQPGPDGLVFVNTRGNTPHLSSFSSQTWRKARGRVGRPDLVWHDLRHTVVALAIANGAHPKEIQEMMGHSSIVVTLDIYGHLFPALGESLADGLDATYQAALAAPKKSARVVRIARR